MDQTSKDPVPGDDPAERIPSPDGTDWKDQAGSIGDAVRQDPGNLGDEVPVGADRTFPEVQPSDRTF